MAQTKASTSTTEDFDVKPFSHISKKDSKGTGIGKGEKWAGEDRRALFLYVEKNGAGNWTAAATSVPGKSAKQGSVDKLSPFLQKACQAA